MRHAERSRRGAQPGVERVQRFDFHLRRRGDGDERVLRHAAHRRDVAERAAERLPADAARIVAREKMDAFHDDIGLQQLPALVARPADDRAIVAGADAHIGARAAAPRVSSATSRSSP